MIATEYLENTLKQWNREYKKGFTSYMVLLLLFDKAMYGYEITTKLSELTNSKISFQDSGSYQILKNLKSKKFITSENKKSDQGPNRIYYSVTSSGKELIERFTYEYIVPINSALNNSISKHFPDCFNSNVSKGDIDE